MSERARRALLTSVTACVAMLAPSVAAPDQFTLAVEGKLLAPAGGPPELRYEPKPGEKLGLYTQRTPSAVGNLATCTTDTSGRCRLVKMAPRFSLEGTRLYVVREETGRDGWSADPELVSPATAGTVNETERYIERRVEGLRLKRLDAVAAGPRGAAEAVAALARTSQVKAWAGAESIQSADDAVLDAVARVEEGLKPEERGQFTKAFYAAAAPVRAPSKDGLPALPALAPDRFADELVAAAPGWRFERDPEPRPGSDHGYAQVGGRHEGSVVAHVGAAFKVVSVTTGDFSVNPTTQRSIALTWPTPQEHVCLEANPLDPDVRWRMRKALKPGVRSFEWDLSLARDAGLADGGIGVLARPCRTDGPSAAVFLPVRWAGQTTTAAAYRVAFTSPAPLWTVEAKLFHVASGKAREVPLPAGSVAFDDQASSPLVTVAVPAGGLEPGVLRLELRGRGPSGAFGPESASFLHEKARE